MLQKRRAADLEKRTSALPQASRAMSSAIATYVLDVQGVNSEPETIHFELLQHAIDVKASNRASLRLVYTVCAKCRLSSNSCVNRIVGEDIEVVSNLFLGAPSKREDEPFVTPTFYGEKPDRESSQPKLSDVFST